MIQNLNIAEKQDINEAALSHYFGNQNNTTIFLSEAITHKTTEQEYYQLISAKYGFDVMILAKLRLNEIYRASQEELKLINQDQPQQEHSAIAIGNEFALLFLQKFFALLKRDYNFSNILAADEDVRTWIIAFVQNKQIAILSNNN